MNDVKTFRAASLQEALSVVRREMGEEALILNTRQVSKKRFIPWLRAKQQIEVTASLVAESSASVAVSSGVAELDIPSAHVLEDDMGLDLAFVDSDDSTESSVTKAADIAAELGKRHADKNRLEHNLKSLEDSYDDLLPELTPQADVGVESMEKVASQAAKLISQAKATASEENDTLATKLDSLQKMVQNLTRSTHFRGAEEIPFELFEIYTQLMDADVEDDLARELIFGLRELCPPDQLSDPAISHGLLSGMVESELNCTVPISIEPGRRKVVALVGPTGVGKTTTIAKLAANFRLRDGVKMGLVTVDTYRIAAVEQLRTYAEIIDLPMKVVTSPQEMRRALDDLAGLDLVLIDTAGRSPRDELKIQELRSMLNEACVDEVHLVMSLTASVRSIALSCEQFQGVNPTALVLTKLDEAAGMGSLLSVARQVSLPISYLTTGQDVPEDIEPADATRVARLVLGEDRLFD
jgi:flagellar biosynthesis protein FlhF